MSRRLRMKASVSGETSSAYTWSPSITSTCGHCARIAAQHLDDQRVESVELAPVGVLALRQRVRAVMRQRDPARAEGQRAADPSAAEGADHARRELGVGLGPAALAVEGDLVLGRRSGLEVRRRSPARSGARRRRRSARCGRGPRPRRPRPSRPTAPPRSRRRNAAGVRGRAWPRTCPTRSRAPAKRWRRRAVCERLRLMQGVARIRTVIVGAIAVAAAVVATPASGSTLSCDGTARAGAGGAPELLTNCGRIDPSLGANAARGPRRRPARSQPRRPSLEPRRRRRRPHPRRPHRAVAAERPRDPGPLRRGRPRVQRRRGNALGAQQRDLRAPAIASRADRPRAGTWHRQRGDRRRHRASRRAHHPSG